MNKFDEKLAQYVEDAKKIGIAIDENLLKLVTKLPLLRVLASTLL